MGVNVFEIRELINARPDRHVHVPGAGVGGHCLPKDSWLLQYGLETYGSPMGEEAEGLRLIPLAREINDGMPAHMLDLIEETPAAALAKLLLAPGAEVVAHDPFVRAPTLWAWPIGSACWATGTTSP